MRKLVGYGLVGLVIGTFIGCVLLISGKPIAETVYLWGNLVTMDSFVMIFFLKIKSMTFIEVKLAIVGIFALVGLFLGMFVAAFFIVDDIFAPLMKGAFLLALLFFIFGSATEPSVMYFYYPLIGGILGAVIGAILAAIGESFS
jgi:hypothetical protein